MVFMTIGPDPNFICKGAFFAGFAHGAGFCGVFHKQGAFVFDLVRMEGTFEKFVADGVELLFAELETPFEDCRGIRYEYGRIPFDSLNTYFFGPGDKILVVLKVFAMQCHL